MSVIQFIYSFNDAKVFAAFGVGLFGLGMLGRCMANCTSNTSQKVDRFAQEEILKIAIYQNKAKKYKDVNCFVYMYYADIYTNEQSCDSKFFLEKFEFASKCKYVDFNLHNNFGDINRLKIPDKLSYKILRFLQIGRPESDFCCFDFVNSMFNKYRELHYFCLSDWNIEEYRGDEFLSPGDAVLLHVSAGILPKQLDDLRHSAIYIGDNTYISLYGTRGPIAFSSMGQMKKTYDAQSVLILRP